MRKLIIQSFTALFLVLFMTGCEIAITPLEEGSNQEVDFALSNSIQANDQNSFDAFVLGNVPAQIQTSDIRVELSGDRSESFESSFTRENGTITINIAIKEEIIVPYDTVLEINATVFINEVASCVKVFKVPLTGRYPNTPPTIAGTPITAVNVDATYTFTPEVNNPDENDTLTFSVENQPEWTSFDTQTGELSGTPAAGDTGITTGVAISVTDTSGSTATLPLFDISVITDDTQPPVITRIGNATETVDVNSLYNDAGATAVDNVDGDITANIVTSGVVDTTTVGTYTITYDVNDSSGNSATQVSRSVTVQDNTIVDTTAPVITLLGNPVVTVEVGMPYSDAGSTAVDDIDGDLTNNIIVNHPVDTNEEGTFTITYDVNDSSGNSAVQVTRTVNVVNRNVPPVANDDLANETFKNIPKDIYVIGNDSDANGNQTIRVVSVQALSAQGAVVTIQATQGNVLYTPVYGFSGLDSFTYTISDGEYNATATVQIDVKNRTPKISGNPVSTINEDAFYSFIPTSNDDDNDTLTFDIVNQPSWAEFNTTNGVLFGIPVNDDIGVTTGVVISVSDGTSEVNLSAFDLTVVNVNDAPEVQNLSITMDEDTNVTVTLSATDVDSNISTIRYEIVTEPGNGDVNLSGNLFTYVPNPDYNASDSFTYRAIDDSNASSTEAIVNISVNDLPDNSIPEAFDVNVSAQMVTTDIVLVGQDNDGDTLEYQLVSLPAYGQLLQSIIGGSDVTYDSQGYLGSSSFTYRVFDGKDYSNIATVYIESNLSNTPPRSSNQSTQLDAGGGTITLIAADDNPEQNLTYRVVTDASYGTLTLVDNNVTYTPDAGFTGTDDFTFVANDGVDDSNISRVTVRVGSHMPASYLFSWCDSAGQELWSSDGSVGNTTLLKDINPGSQSSSPENFIKIGETFFFIADDGIHGKELWKSEGTAGSTVLIKDIYEGNMSAEISNLTEVNGTLYFAADDGVHGKELWKSDGTSIGTQMVKNINADGNSVPQGLVDVEGMLYFVANDGEHGYELWKSNGSEQGTCLVEDLASGSNSSIFQDIGSVNGLVVFSAITDVDQYLQLYSSDGVLTNLVYNFGWNMFGQFDMVSIGDMLFFSAYNDTYRRELWKSDGITAELVKDIHTFNYFINLASYPENLTDVNGTLYFTAADQGGVHELWQSDGSEMGTTKITPSTQQVSELTSGNDGKLYFISETGDHQRFFVADQNKATELFKLNKNDGIEEIIGLEAYKQYIFMRVIKTGADELWGYDTASNLAYQIVTGCTP